MYKAEQSQSKSQFPQPVQEDIYDDEYFQNNIKNHQNNKMMRDSQDGSLANILNDNQQTQSEKLSESKQ